MFIFKMGYGGFGGSAGIPVIPGTVPRVVRSSIPAKGDGIGISFDRPMTHTAKLQDAMTVIVNGKAPVHPDHIDISPDKTIVGLMFPKHFFKHGDIVTWAYNDQHPTEELKGAEPKGVEIDNQTYAVTNNTVDHTPKIISSEIYPNNAHRIVVMWDREMHGDPDIHMNMSIIKNGGAALLPKAVVFAAKAMMMTLNVPAKSSDTYEWAFNDTDPGAILADKDGNSADTAHHSVDNKTPGISSLKYVSSNVSR